MLHQLVFGRRGDRKIAVLTGIPAVDRVSHGELLVKRRWDMGSIRLQYGVARGVLAKHCADASGHDEYLPFMPQ